VTLLAKIAEGRRVDAARGALELLALPGSPGRDVLGYVADAATAAALFRRVWRRVAIVLHLAGSADEIAETFAVATLFDHYCARHHVGGAIDLEAARALRASIDGALGDARRALAGRGLRGARDSARRLLSFGPRAARRLGFAPSGSEPRAAGSGQAGGALVPERVEPGTAARPRGVAARSRAALADAVGAWSEDLIRAFDRRWSARAGHDG
jgi:hypothetical protein